MKFLSVKIFICIILLLILFSSCRPKQTQIEKITEDGVEVIINHLEPYEIKGELNNLYLEKIFSINTENKEFFKIGLIDLETFDIDHEGNIFVIRWRTDENYIFKFDKDGNFIKSFCRRGQGPGELEWGETVFINFNDELVAKDPGKTKFLVFDRDGNFLRETHLEKHYSISPLAKGKYGIMWQDQSPEIFKNHYAVCDSDFSNIQEFFSYEWEYQIQSTKVLLNRASVIYGMSKNYLYIGNAEKGYEIYVYDLTGTMVRKIRKKFNKIRVPEDYKKARLERIPARFRARREYYFNEYWPPFKYLFVDDAERLYVMTYEQRPDQNEYIYDIFNNKGIFINRISLGNMGLRPLAFPATAKRERLYCIIENENGYKELVVYKMIWE